MFEFMSNQRSGLPPRQAPKPVSKGSNQKRKKASGFKRFMQVFIALIFTAIIAGGCYIGFLYVTLDKALDEAGNDGVVAPENAATVKPLTILLLGTDYRIETKTHLSDVVMVMSMNPKTNSATIVSLPRDTKLQLDGYHSNKLNAFYPTFLSKEKKGGKPAKQEMKTMMSKYLDIDIDYTVVLNFQAFRDIVDAVKGVDVNVDANMCYRDTQDGTNINLKKGPKHLDGKEALDYVRYRKSNCKPKTAGSDDFSRNRRQNEVLNALVDQAKSLNGVLGAGNVIKAVGNNMSTDIENQQMKNMISAYWDISKEDIHFVPVTGEWRSPYVYINKKQLGAAKQALKDELAGVRSPEKTKSKNTN